MENKEDGYEDPTPKPAPEDGKEGKSRLDALENDVGEMKGTLTKILTVLESNKSATKSDDNDEDDKGKEPKPSESEDKDKKKEVGTPEVKPKANPEGEGDDAKNPVKLPKASAGETDGKGPSPAGNAGPELVQKNEEIVKKLVAEKVKEVLKGYNITKTQTPRTTHEDVTKQTPGQKGELAMDFLKRAKAGEITLADMNRETRDIAKKAYESNIAKVLNAEVQ